MRYSQECLPEIIGAYARDELYFAAIRMIRNGDDRVFELGISRLSYSALRRTIQTRPFDQTAGLAQRLFFVPSYRNCDDVERCIGTIRIEQGRDAKNFEFEMPMELIANMLWFCEMKTLRPAKRLRSWVPTKAIPEYRDTLFQRILRWARLAR